MNKLALLLLPIVGFAQAQVVGVGNFIHNVADLDKSVAFYHDVLGLEMQRPASAFLNTPEVLNLYNAAGGEYRVATAQVPGVPMRIELAEFKGVERKPVRRGISEPGASILVLTVRDLDPIFANIKAAGLKTLLVPTEMIRGRRLVALADPDGFFVEIVEREDGPAAPAGNFVDLGFAFVVRDASAMARVFFSVGVAPGGSGDFEVMTAGFARPFHIEVVERKKASAPPQNRPQDPGAAVLRLLVRDAGAAVDNLAKVGVKVVSAKGEMVTLPGATPRHVAILGAPDNLFIQVMQ